MVESEDAWTLVTHIDETQAFLDGVAHFRLSNYLLDGEKFVDR